MRLAPAGVGFLTAATVVGVLLSPAGALGAEGTDGVVTAVVQLTGDPVTVASARSGRPLTSDAEVERRSLLRAAQAPVAARVRELGGTVLADYQSAYNGLKVRIAERRLADLGALPGVAGVHATRPVAVSNARGLPLVGAPATWDGAGSGLRGEGVKVALLDTGIDYTHADFGGTATIAAYQAARAAGTEKASWMFGPRAPKVKGGIDLVGDSYNADPADPGYQPVPQPDPNPLDCNGHGTHLAGTIAGFGVLSDGRTYRGDYDAGTIGDRSWLVAPGVAPKADLYAVRIFGCRGSSDALLDGIEWAVDHDMDVIAMAVADPYGTADTPEAEAADNAARAGAIVVAASGSDGRQGSPYLTGSPGTGDRVISVAASDPVPTHPGARLTFDLPGQLDATIINNAPLPTRTLTYTALNRDFVPLDPCDEDSWSSSDVSGKFVHVSVSVPWPLTCPGTRIEALARDAGAAAVYLTDFDLPAPWALGDGNPDDGSRYARTVPLLSRVRSVVDDRLLYQGLTKVTLTPIATNNTGQGTVAGFSSAGPRFGDHRLKPDVTAPGANVASASIGTGILAAPLSGSSMAAAFTAGTAALVKQAHPTWAPDELRAAIVSTSDSTKVNGYAARRAGNGLIQAIAATRTQAVAVGSDGTTPDITPGTALDYGRVESKVLDDYTATRTLTVRNHGDAPLTFEAHATQPQGNPHTVSLGASTVVVPAHGEATLDVSLAVPPHVPTSGFDGSQVAGVVTLSPKDGGNAGVQLRVPYYLIPVPVSDIGIVLDTRTLVRTGSVTTRVTNESWYTTYSQWFVWTRQDADEPENRFNDVRAVGVVDGPGGLTFGIALYRPASNPAANEYRVYLDIDRDGTDDFLVSAVNPVLAANGRPSGERPEVVIRDLATGEAWIGGNFVTAPRGGTHVGFAVSGNDLGHKGKGPFLQPGSSLDYTVAVRGLVDGTTDVVDRATWTVGEAPLSSDGDRKTYAHERPAWVTSHYDAAKFAASPVLGFYVAFLDNPALRQVQLARVRP